MKVGFGSVISLVAVGIETWKLKTIESFGFDGNGIKLPNLMSVSFCSLFQNLGPQALTFSQRRKRGPHCTQILKKNIWGLGFGRNTDRSHPMQFPSP